MMGPVNFDDLPYRSGDPRRSAWGVWGDDDELGTLNLLNESTAKAAAQVVKYGIVCPLNLPLNTPTPLNPARRKFGHEILNRGHCNDDEVSINTQSSSQMDGLRHYPYQDTLQYYMGKTQKDFTGPDAGFALDITNQARKGIFGRGVLLDYARWAERQGISIHAFSTQSVTVDELEAVVSAQGIQFEVGDILLVRFGFTKQYKQLSEEEQQALGQRTVRSFIGLEGSDKTLRWLWERSFSVVGGDTNAFEAWPPKQRAGTSLHEVLLAGWGCPIMELLDLEHLAEECHKHRKYSFAFSAAPLNIPKGVASTANALAVL